MLVIKNARLRAILRILVPAVLLPAVILVGTFLFDEKKHAFVILAVTALSVLFFLCGFEKKKIGTRRLILVCVMTALSVVGRFIPFFKPVTAFSMITGMYLGGEAGFLVGAMSAVISNFYFGQGPWTPFQMFTWGMTGLLSGILARPMKKSKPFLLVMGVLAGVFYSALMDVWTVLWAGGGFDLSVYTAALLTALPYTVLYSVSNFIFLFFCAKPFGDKLERVKIKYGV